MHYSLREGRAVARHNTRAGVAAIPVAAPRQKSSEIQPQRSADLNAAL